MIVLAHQTLKQVAALSMHSLRRNTPLPRSLGNNPLFLAGDWQSTSLFTFAAWSNVLAIVSTTDPWEAVGCKLQSDTAANVHTGLEWALLAP